MDGAVVIAGQATGTAVVVSPGGWRSDDIVDRAHLLAFPAFDTDLRVDGEFPVGDHPLVEIVAEDVGIESGSGTLVQLLDTPLAVLDDASNMNGLPLCILDLFAGALLGVGVHEWQADIRLGHDDREQCLGLQTFVRQVLVENDHRLSHVVATGGQSPAEGGFVDVERGQADEIPYKAGWLPSVGGETEADAFAFGQCEFVTFCLEEVGDIKQLLAQLLCELLGHPSGVACA